MSAMAVDMASCSRCDMVVLLMVVSLLYHVSLALLLRCYYFGCGRGGLSAPHQQILSPILFSTSIDELFLFCVFFPKKLNTGQNTCSFPHPFFLGKNTLYFTIKTAGSGS